MEVIEELKAEAAKRPVELKEESAQGRKIVGFVPSFLPEELVYASGAVPYALIRGGEPEPVAASLAYTSRFLDTYVRSQIGYWALREEPIYQSLDLLVAPCSDRNISALADMWEFYTGTDVFRIGMPHNKGELAFDYYLSQLALLKEKLESLVNVEVKDSSLEDSIRLYNRMNSALKKISFSRKVKAPPISGKDFAVLNHLSFACGIDAMVEKLESLAQELEGKQGEKALPRVLLIGSTLAMGDYTVYDLLENAGIQIVFEESCEGMRQYLDNVEPNGDLLRSLADKYLMRRTMPAFFRPPTERIKFLVDMAKEFKADGVILYNLLYRDGYDIESYYLPKVFERELNIPALTLISDYDAEEKKLFRTRIEAFAETLKKRS